MSISKGPSEGGQGGKLGHSNMSHWDYTEAIKEAARKRRRLKAKAEIAEGLAEFLNKEVRELTDDQATHEFSR